MTADFDRYRNKGMGKEDAQRVAAQIMLDKQGALDTLTREELGIDLGNAQARHPRRSATVTSVTLGQRAETTR
jgi:hypothetical protein